MIEQQDNGIAGRESGNASRPAATEIAAGGVFVVIACIASWSLLTDPYLELGRVGSDPGPAFIPWIATAVLGLGGAAQMIWAIMRARRAGGMRMSGEFVITKLWLPVLLILMLIAYQIAMRPLGFVTASVVFAFPCIALIHWRSGGAFTKRYLLQLPIEAVLIACGIYALFSYGINVPFP